MQRAEKTVFMSYRRTNAPWALAIFKELTQHGFDVFYDYGGIASGDFEQVILGNIKARAHFLILLTPSALERCDDPNDLLRREIETAIDTQRNIVPLMIDRFDFGAPAVAEHLTGKLATLKRYNALEVSLTYFDAAMERLRNKYLNIPLDAVLHPASSTASEAARHQQAAAGTAPPVRAADLTAQQWFERGFAASDPDEKLRCYTETIRLKPDFAAAYYNRGISRKDKGDLDGALRDYNEAIRLKPDYSDAYNNRGVLRREMGDLDGALRDYEEMIRLTPGDADAYNNRGILRKDKGDLDGALRDHDEAIRLKPDHSDSYNNRGAVRGEMGDLDGALRDYDEAIRLTPDHAEAYYNRAVLRDQTMKYADAIADFEKYLDLGGGIRDGDQAAVEQRIQGLKKG